MENQRADQEDALRFARVWKRVMPEGGPIVPAFPLQPVEAAEAEPKELPAGEGEDAIARFFRGQIAGELRLGREGKHLWQRTGCGDFAACASGAEKRARRLAAALYLMTGEWYLPVREAASQQDGKRTTLRTLYRGLQALELEYLAQAAQMQDRENATRLEENASSCRQDEVRLRRLLEQWGPL